MKKLLFIASLLVFSLTSNAQTWNALSTGSTADTMITSLTFSKTFKVVSTGVPTVSVQIFVDSISGQPNGTATLYQSLDNINWESTGQAATFVNGNDTAFYLTDTAFGGLYGKISVVATDSVQRSQIRATKMQWQSP